MQIVADRLGITSDEGAVRSRAVGLSYDLSLPEASVSARLVRSVHETPLQYTDGNS